MQCEGLMTHECDNCKDWDKCGPELCEGRLSNCYCPIIGKMTTDLLQWDDLETNIKQLISEASETIHAGTKIQLFGLHDFHPKNGMDNREKLEKELGHFLALVDVLIANKTIREQMMEKFKQEKFESMGVWYNYRSHT